MMNMATVTTRARLASTLLAATTVLGTLTVTWVVGRQGGALAGDAGAAGVVGVGLALLWLLTGRAAGIVWALWRKDEKRR